MSKNWNRKIEVIFGGKLINLEDFEIGFKYTFDTDEEPNEVEITVDNLQKATINANIVKNKQLILNAGYEGDIGNIMKGFIASTKTDFTSETKTTTIFGIDASDTYLDKSIVKSYKKNTKASDIIKDLSKITGLALGEVKLKKDVQYPRGRSVNGKLRTILKDIVTKDCKTNLQIINGTIIIREIGQGLQTGFVLNADTGLIGSPEALTKTDSKEKDKQADYKIKCFLNYNIAPMTRLKIESETLKATVVVLRGTHSGSRSGDFVTEVEVKLV